MLEKGLWFIIALLFSFFLSQGSWIPAIAILGGILFVAALTAGLYPMAILLLVGPATFFVFLNSYLNAIPFATMERIIFLTLLSLTLIKICLKQGNRTKLVPVEILMMFFLSYTLISLITTFEDKALFTWLSKDVSLYFQGYFMPMATFMIIRRLPWSEEKIELLFKFVIAAGAFLGLTSILQLFLGLSIFIPDYMTLGLHTQERALGTFTNASEYGLVLSVFILIGIFMYTRTKDLMLKILLMSCLALMAVGLILSKTRAPWLGALLSLAFIFLYDKRVRPLLITSTGCATLIGIIIAPFVLDLDSFSTRVLEITPILNRLAVWIAALNMMAQNPILGIGFGKDSFKNIISDYAVNIGPISGNWASKISEPHNELLFIASHTGILGAIIYFFIFLHIFKILRAIHKSPSSAKFEKDISLYMGAVFICFFSNALLVDIGIFNYSFLLMYFLFGIASIFYANEKDQVQFFKPPKLGVAKIKPDYRT